MDETLILGLSFAVARFWGWRPRITVYFGVSRGNDALRASKYIDEGDYTQNKSILPLPAPLRGARVEQVIVIERDDTIQEFK